MIISENEIKAIEKRRKEYKPNKTVLLFVGESLPQRGTFFYHGNSNLFRYTKEAFAQSKIPFSIDLFKQYGCWLSDVCDSPVNGLSASERRLKIKLGLPAIHDLIAKINPEYIVVVKKGDMERFVFRSICTELGFVENKTAYNLPFPACGNQHKYRNELSAVLNRIFADKVEL